MMRKSNLLSRAEMKKIVGGDAPLEPGCYVKCTTSVDLLYYGHKEWIAWTIIPDCSAESQSICFGGTPSDCFCVTPPGGGGLEE